MRSTCEESPTISKGAVERMTRGNNASDGKNKYRVMRQGHARQGKGAKLDGISPQTNEAEGDGSHL